MPEAVVGDTRNSLVHRSSICKKVEKCSSAAVPAFGVVVNAKLVSGKLTRKATNIGYSVYRKEFA